MTDPEVWRFFEDLILDTRSPRRGTPGHPEPVESRAT